MAKKRRTPRRDEASQAPASLPAQEPRTGVGTPDEHVAPAGIALGGDTGDVGTPRGTLGGSAGSPYGASADTEWSTVWDGPHKPAKNKRAT